MTPANTPSETSRTDQVLRDLPNTLASEWITKLTDHARKLERELAASEERERVMRKVLEDFDNWICDFNPGHPASRLEGRKVLIRARAAIARTKEK